MATEHEIGRDQSLGWVQSSSCRYYPSGSWGSWCEKSMPASGSPAMSSRDCIKSYCAQFPDHGSEQLRELDEDNWVRASESTEDICDKNSQYPDSPECDMGRTAENVSDNMEASDSESEEFRELEIKRKCSGLTNLGNTCFMNSVLQCLTYTVPLANKILSSHHKITCKSQEFCAMCAMESHIKSVLAASGSTVSPSFLARNLDQISGSFLPGQQQDAHEFLLFFLESIQENSKVHRSCGTQDCQTKGLVSELFMGQMRSQVKCKACSHCSDSFDEFLGLNLDIEHCSSLKEALSSFLAVEDLQEEVKVHCPSCKIPADRSKQLNFKRSPPVLVIQLKRYMASEIFPTKIEKDIKYDLSLDLTPFVIEDATEPIQELDWKYKLYAVLVHSGWSTSSGHYYCFVQTSPGIWHCMNDSLVSRVRERTVLDQEAYLLFYVREGIKETLHLEQAEPIGLEKESARNPQTQTSEISNKYMCDSLMKDKPACGKHKELDTDVNNPATSCRVPPSKHSGSSEQEHVDIVVANVANNEEDPHGNAKKAVEKNLSSTSSLEQQVLKRFVSGVSVVANVANNEEDPHGNAKKAVEKNLSSTSSLEQQALKRSCSASREKGSLETEEPKQSPQVKAHSTSRMEKILSPSAENVNHASLNSFENGSQYSYVRLLNKMPSSRRQALLASAMSGHETSKQSSPKIINTKEKSKLASVSKQVHSLQAGMVRATSHLLQKGEQHDDKGKDNSREKPWAQESDHANGRKLQRVGFKRVMASFRE